MYYCPYCGTGVEAEEHYCMKCGKALPNIEARVNKKNTPNRWILPLAMVLLMIISIGLFSYVLNYKNTKALELYMDAEKLLLEESYEEANSLLEQALDYRKDFTQADVALQFTSAAIQVEDQLKKAENLLEEKKFKATTELLHDTGESLNLFHGSAVSTLVDKIDHSQAIVRLEELQEKIANSPAIEEIRMLIWEAEEINHPEAKNIATQLRNQLIDYTFSKASEALNDKQFSDALLITEDGLKYAPDSEKLQSLLTNINKEKLSFESAIKERMEQAMDTAYQEHQVNENDAIKLLSVETENDDDGRLVVKGEVESIATVPINSVLIEYSLYRNDELMLTNEIYVYPDVLYPNEQGKFEFTHFDLKDKHSKISVDVQKITWYTE